jgi:outer membrane protein assembly factor BamC
VVPLTPEQLWPQLRAFWEQRGFKIDSEDAQAGVLETKWSENRGKLPDDAVRNTVGSLLGRLFDTGERDRFRTRIERTAAGSEVYISHRAAEEVYSNDQRDSTHWRAKPSDPQLEAEMLSRLMAALGPKEESTRTAGAAAGQPASAGAAEGAPRARTVAGASAALEFDEPFDRAWRRVGLALDRSGFSVEDRDRAAGLYYVRYVDPKNAGKEEPGFWARLFGDSTSLVPVRYRVALKADGGKTLISVLTSAGAADTGDNARRIAAQLVTELR